MNALGKWLERLEQLQPDRMELGLSRIQRVAKLADLDNPRFRVVTIGGTNGKGSTAAYVAEILQSLKLSTGIYTSPHFIDFNERIVVDKNRVSAAELCEAFELIDRVRGDIDLTYFEFTTLAAIHCFGQRNVDVAVMEVGLGGRLDAVNAWDSEVACVTSVGIDHTDWLGEDREKIGFEKASIARAGCALVCGDNDPPASIAHTTAEIGAELFQVGRDFDYRTLSSDQWEYSDADGPVALPIPAIPGNWATGNASVAICATSRLLGRRAPLSTLETALKRVTVAGRMQLTVYRNTSVILDVAHNADAAKRLSEYLKALPVTGKTIAVFSCMEDKDLNAILRELSCCMDSWCVADLGIPRSVAISQLTGALADAGVNSADVFVSVTTAFEAAVAQSSANDRVVVFGSFHVVGPVLHSISAL